MDVVFIVLVVANVAIWTVFANLALSRTEWRVNPDNPRYSQSKWIGPLFTARGWHNVGAPCDPELNARVVNGLNKKEREKRA